MPALPRAHDYNGTVRAAAIAVMLASCSWLTVTPPAAAPQPPGDCTMSYAAPAIDTTVMMVGVVGSVIGAIALLGASSESDATPAEAGVVLFIGLPSLAAAIAFGKSSSYGYRNTSACRERLGKDR